MADWAALVSGSALDFGKAEPIKLPDSPGGERLHKALRAYEDQVLGRFTVERRFVAAQDALARLAEDRRPAALGMFLALILARLESPPEVAIPTGILRGLGGQTPTELGLSGKRARQEEATTLQLAADLEQLVRAARAAPLLIGDDAVFALGHPEWVAKRANRVGLRQILDAAANFEQGLPRGVRRRRRDGGTTPSRLDDASQYPVGGFASLTNQGSFENLVPSELIYMDDVEEGELDAFSVRWAESELLYYARDESVLVRRRRAITFWFGPDLVGWRFKDKALPWQRLVGALGLTVALSRRLVELLGDEDLVVRWAFSGAGPHGALASEQEWMSRLAADLPAAHVETQDPGSALERELRHEVARGVVSVVVFGDSPFEVPPGVEVVRVALVQGRPVFQGIDEATPLMGAWEALGRGLLEGLV